MTKDYLKKLISVGYSVIPCHEHKAPIEEGWTKAKTKTADDVDKFNPY